MRLPFSKWYKAKIIIISKVWEGSDASIS
jgi:hypothetical protein